MNRPITSVNAIIRFEGKYLLIRRAKAPYKDFWALPGGKLENGETIQEGILREVKEETGLDGKFLGINCVFHERTALGKDYIVFLCTVDVSSSDFVESDEGNLNWFSSFPEGMLPQDRHMAEKYMDCRVDVSEIFVEEEGRFAIE